MYVSKGKHRARTDQIVCCGEGKAASLYDNSEWAFVSTIRQHTCALGYVYTQVKKII